MSPATTVIATITTKVTMPRPTLPSISAAITPAATPTSAPFR
jgi:hypothetical protein